MEPQTNKTNKKVLPTLIAKSNLVCLFVLVLLGIEPRTSFMLDKLSTMKLHAQPYQSNLKQKRPKLEAL